MIIKDKWGHTVVMKEYTKEGREIWHWSDGAKTIAPFVRNNLFNIFFILFKNRYFILFLIFAYIFYIIFLR